ncbi:hypothetical protein CCP3SC5AM1_2320002 [Gammaproteobacteria bacterium]
MAARGFRYATPRVGYAEGAAQETGPHTVRPGVQGFFVLRKLEGNQVLPYVLQGNKAHVIRSVCGP